MSNVPTIPDFAPTTESMANALRAVKLAVEKLAGQSEETGAAVQVYASQAAPRQNVGVTLSTGDIWVETGTRKIFWWDGNQWTEFGAQISDEQVNEIVGAVSQEFVDDANAILVTSVSARDIALQAQADAEAASVEADAYRLQAESARDSALVYRSEAQAARDEATEIATSLTAIESSLVSQIEATNATLVNEYLTAVQTNTAIAAATTNLKSELEGPTGSIGQLSATLDNEYYTIVQTDQAIASSVTTLESTLLNEIADTNATLTTDYLTSTQTEAAISSATTALKTQLEGPSGSIGQLSATLTNDYYTATQTDSAISSATQSLQSSLEAPTGSIGQINATLTSDYYTVAQTNAAISSATTTLKSELEGPTGSIGVINAALENDYYTIADTNSAIAAESNTLKALVRDSFTPVDFAQSGAYWTQSINATPAAAVDLGTPFTFVTVSTLGRSARIAAPQAAAQIITPKEALSNIPGKSYRVTIRARHNNAFAGNSQSALRFGLRPLNTSYAGTTNLSLTTLTFTAANTNETFTFEVTTTGTTAFVRPFVEVLNTNFGTAGPTIDISFFEMVDSSAAASVLGTVTATLSNDFYTRAQADSAISSSITNYNAQLIAPTGAVGSLSADLTTNYYTKVDTDGAISTAINQFEANVVDGLSAQVESQQTAIATLEGNAQAVVAFRAVAGSAGAELELVSSANPDGAVSTARIVADNIILDGTVQRIKLAQGAVSDLSSFSNDPVYTDTATTNYSSWRSLVAVQFDLGATDDDTPERILIDMAVSLDSLSFSAPASGDWGYRVAVMVDIMRRNRATGVETLWATLEGDMYEIGHRNRLIFYSFASVQSPRLVATMRRGSDYFAGEDIVLRYYWLKTRTTTSGTLTVQLKNARAYMIKFFR